MPYTIAPKYLDTIDHLAFRWRRKTRVDILVVVDTEIATQPGVGFGVGSVIELIRQTQVGCMRFDVDIALRNGEAPNVPTSSGPFEPDYRGFRFDMQHNGVDVIQKYEQIWCFGFKPSNSGSNDDTEIDATSAFPASDAELARLARWQDERKGGLFGTGDHHFLGASMCRRIPRLGSMRRWTNADGVPPINTPARIDTLRPPSPAYEPGAPGGPANMNNSPHQGDGTPQPIQWTRWQSMIGKGLLWPFFRRSRPHPVLCHPSLGPIDVMPDHAHEGLCVPTSELVSSGKDKATYDFDGSGAKHEYPPALNGGPRPLPEIIAYGSTLGSPPYAFGKGPQPHRPRFPMISVYDGHKAGVGRVATDSTWHHWMDVNLLAFKAANGETWKKISRYFINLAVWLNPPGFSTRCFWIEVLATHFEYPGFEEYKRLSIRELGAVARRWLGRKLGPCWVSERIWWDIFMQRKILPWEVFGDRAPRFDFGGIDPRVYEDAYLGAIVRATMKVAQRARLLADKSQAQVPALESPEKLLARPIEHALREVTEELRGHYAGIAKTLDRIAN